MLGSVTNALRGCCILPTLNQALKGAAGTASLLSGAAAVALYLRKHYYNPQTPDGQAWKQGVTKDPTSSTLWSALFGSSTDALSQLKAAKKHLQDLRVEQKPGQAKAVLATINKQFPNLDTEKTSTDTHTKAVGALKDRISSSNTWILRFIGKTEETAENQNRAIKCFGLASLTFAAPLFVPLLVGRVRQVTGL